MVVKSAYLNALIDKEIYVQQPPEYEVHNNNNKLMFIKEITLWSETKWANWNNTLTEYLLTEGLTFNVIDPCAYIKTFGEDDYIITLFWVNYILIAGGKLETIEKVEQKLTKTYQIDDRGKLNWFLGIDFVKTDDCFIMSQERYVKNMHNRLNMSDCNPVSMPVVQRRSFLKPEEDTTVSYPYREAVESLIT